MESPVTTRKFSDIATPRMVQTVLILGTYVDAWGRDAGPIVSLGEHTIPMQPTMADVMAAAATTSVPIVNMKLHAVPIVRLAP